MEASGDHQESAPLRLTVDQVDVEFLPIIYDIIRGLERDPHDTSQKLSQSQDISQKVIELQKKLEDAREQVRRLPGVEYSKEEQLDKLEALRKQLRLKRELLLKYRNMFLLRFLMNERVVNKLADSYPIRRAAKWVVYLVNKTRAITPTENFFNQQPLNREKLKGLSVKVEETLKKIRDDLEKKSKQ